MKALVVSGGMKPSKEIIERYNKEADIIIGVDRGCEYLLEANIIPHYILGDFDSINKLDLEKLIASGAVMHKYDPEKDFTDSELAFQLAFKLKVKEIYFLGATGLRFDHTLGSLGLLLEALNRGVRSFIVDDKNKISLVNKSTALCRDLEYKYISFLAYNEEVTNFSIKQAKYELEGYTLKVGDSRTVSNEFLESDISICFNSGNVLVIYSKDWKNV